MVPAVFALAVLVLFALEGLVLAAGQLRRTRDEAAYWDARANRPDLYDWAKELDL